MAERQPATATHRAYTVIKREGQDDYRLNLGLVFGHQDGKGFNGDFSTTSCRVSH